MMTERFTSLCAPVAQAEECASAEMASTVAVHGDLLDLTDWSSRGRPGREADHLDSGE